MTTPQEAKANAARAYNAAADTYDHPANSFWERFGRGTIERMDLASGSRVLDVCCGSGASVIPAAEKVGPQGSVLGVDLAENLLEHARAKAIGRGLANVTFRVCDMLDLDLPDAQFDAVVCVFGIFFVPDMPAAVRELWRLVRPGGQLAITTWGPDWFEPVNTAFWDAVREVRPDLYKGFNPWDRIIDPASVGAMLSEAGVFTDDIVAVEGTQRLNSSDDSWATVLGSGLRGTFDRLSPQDQEHVREVTLGYARDHGISEIVTNVVYALATKEGAGSVSS